MFGTVDSCILISMITFWCSFSPPLLCVCVRERETASVCVISMCLLTARRYHLDLKSPPSCCWGSWLATIINLRQVAENSEWHANPSWCPSGAPVLTAGENEATLLQTLSLSLSLSPGPKVNFSRESQIGCRLASFLQPCRHTGACSRDGYVRG